MCWCAHTLGVLFRCQAVTFREDSGASTPKSAVAGGRVMAGCGTVTGQGAQTLVN